MKKKEKKEKKKRFFNQFTPMASWGGGLERYFAWARVWVSFSSMVGKKHVNVGYPPQAARASSTSTCLYGDWHAWTSFVHFYGGTFVERRQKNWTPPRTSSALLCLLSHKLYTQVEKKKKKNSVEN